MKKEYLRVFRAFTDESRVRVLELLCEGEQCACVLLESLQISQPTLSHHMKILCQSGIVKSRRVGPWHYYSIDADGCEYASRLVTMIVQRKLPTTLEVMGGLHRLLRVFRRRPAALPTASARTCCCVEESDGICNGYVGN